FNTTSSADSSTLSLHDALPIYPGDPRLLFTMGQTASLWARETTDDELQTQRLNRALANYRLAVAAASENDRVLLSRAHEAMGRIDRKSTRLNSSHDQISYAVFC